MRLEERETGGAPGARLKGRQFLQDIGLFLLLSCRILYSLPS